MELDPADFEPPVDPDDVDLWLETHVDRLTGRFLRFIRATLVPALDAWAGTVTAAGDPAPLDAVDEAWAILIRDEIGDVISGMHLSGALSAWLGGPAQPPDTFGDRWADVVNQAAVDYQRTAVNRLVGVGPAMWGDIRNLTVYSLEAGTSNEALKQAIEDATGMVEQRADTIARTETIGAYNAGSYDGNVALGEHGPSHKQWSAAHDARTRPSHAAVDGTVVEMGATFDVAGHPMLRPHDPAGPASEVVQCRCRLKVYYPGDALPDGSTSRAVESDDPPVLATSPGESPNDRLEEIDGIIHAG